MKSFRPSGMIIPLLTPFHDDGALDLEALRRLTRQMIAAGMHGLFPSGSTGEFFVLSHDERCRVIEVVVQEAAGRVPVYAGTGAISTWEAVALARSAERIGADALAVITPFYITPSQDELFEHYAAIAASTVLPVIIYNNPSRTGGVSLTPATLARLAAIPNMAGIKDSSGDLTLMTAYVAETPDEFVVFQGRDDLLLASFERGAVGGVAAIGNVAPALVVELYAAFMAGDMERAGTCQAKIALLRTALSISTFPSVLKGALALIGDPVGPPRLPVAPLQEADTGAVREVLLRMGLELVAPIDPEPAYLNQR